MKRLLTLIILFLFAFNIQLADASIEDIKIEFQDLDNDGDPDLAIITTNFASGNDIVLVYDQDDDMKESQDYKECCDFDNDVWIFDAFNDGKTELIIDFSDKDGLSAYLYDDINGDKKVDYFINKDGLLIKESASRIKVSSNESEWIKKDGFNYNLEINVDSNWVFWGTNAICKITDGSLDGISDLKINYYDLDNDGDIDLEIWNKAMVGIDRDFDSIMVDVDDNEGIKEYLFWYLLESVFRIDWENGRITHIDQVIPTRTHDGNYFIYFNKKFNNSEIRNGWESPFIFFNLAEDEDEQAEMVIRFVDDEKNYEKDSNKRYYEEVWPSYDIDNDGNLDFSIDLFGKNEYSSLHDYPEYIVNHVSYEDGANWIYSHPWQVALFGYDEDNNFGIGEGYYLNDLFGARIRDYVQKNKELNFYKQIPRKLKDRQEINPHLNGIPKIYFSPIDKRIHLSGAIYGIIINSYNPKNPNEKKHNASDFTKEELSTGDVKTLKKIEYFNTNNNPYLNKWVYYENDLPTKELTYEQPFLTLTTSDSIYIKKTDIQQSLFETIPPRDHQEWLWLKNELEKYQKQIAPDDFQTMFNQFKAPTIEIKDATNIRKTEKGIRYTKDNKDYLIEYNSFSIKEYTKPNLIISKTNNIRNLSIPEELTITLSVINADESTEKTLTDDAINIVAQLFDNDKIVSTKVIPILSPNNTKTVTFNFVLLKGEHNIKLKLDSSSVENISGIDFGKFTIERDLDLKEAKSYYDSAIFKALYFVLIGLLSIPIVYYIYHSEEK